MTRNLPSAHYFAALLKNYRKHYRGRYRPLLLPCLALLLLLLSSCLSLKLALRLPQKPGAQGTLELEYRFSESLQNISNYPAPHDDIAPLPLPLWEWDFRSIAAQSPTIELLRYSFRPAKKAGSRGIVRVRLGFASAADLRLLLGPELQWQAQRANQGPQFRWQLNAASAEAQDASYPQLNRDGNALSPGEHQMLEQIFTGETLDIQVRGPSGLQLQQQIALADFLTGKQDIDLQSP